MTGSATAPACSMNLIVAPKLIGAGYQKKIPSRRVRKGKYSHEKQTPGDLFGSLNILSFLSVFFLELINTSCSIYKHFLASKERM
jgi:hypothetical protein